MNNKSITICQVAPELRPSLRFFPSLPLNTAWARWLIRTALKIFVSEKHHQGVKVDKETIHESIALRIYTPENIHSQAALLWIHGGGMLIGDALQDDQFCADTARTLGIVVVSTNYRLAPEYPFPAPVDDCYSAWKWLQGTAQSLHIDKAKVAIGGQSAGGGLAASLVQRVHDEDDIQPVAQWLFCPMLDDQTAAQRELDALAHPVWNNRLNRAGWRAFLATEPGAESIPAYAVPARRKNLSGLPPSWIGAGDIELFFDEDKSYADRLSEAGVDSTFVSIPGAYHGFEAIAANTSIAQAYLSRSREWLQKKLTTS